MNLTTAKACLRLSKLVYGTASIDERSTDTQVVFGGLANDPSVLIVAFRGTRGIRDVLTDAKFLFKARWSGDSKGDPRVHRGCLEAVRSVAERIRNRALDFAKVIIAGHSLGGGLAAPTALWLHERGIFVSEVHTFGSLRPGNGDFSALYNSNLHDVTFRWEAEGDLIPWSPPWALGYRHVGREMRLNNDGTLQADPPLWALTGPAVKAVVGDVKQWAMTHCVETSRIGSLFYPHYISNYEKLLGGLS
ncbi:MAG TPA: lipase family protein [Verrucomicrobiota bacterium]|nr:lipase family protein [Verrucomicrobiota bacterium]